MASIGTSPPAIGGLGAAARVTVVTVLTRLAGCLCTRAEMDDIVHKRGGEDWIQGGAA